MSKCRTFLYNPLDFFHRQFFIIFSTFLIVTTLCSVLAQVHLSISLFLILLQQQLLHTKKLHGLIGVGSDAECVGCAEGFVRFTYKLRQQCGRQTGTRATCSTHLNSCAMFFSRHCCRLMGVGVELFSPYTDTSVLFCLFTVSDTCVMHFVVWKG